ncbi:hypothetical protein LH51_05255 [Nitrincola sp. A-D6]|uniref:hypothetical protein n=1 Tax=Nitrincola sp. A-D6 TaxID=1545442 RepID=UPI00051F9F64|nr:hypothetical protein [Nitrincola sp. A-D6]KGK42702.1 hypothetical protein LH51_05255 [Nitrincola sp. A-D6]
MHGKSLISRLVSLTLLGVLFFTPPLLLLFDIPAENGLSWLPVWLFSGWLVLIMLTAWVMERSDEE